MAVILAREYPDIFAAVGVHSGLPQGAAHDIASAFAAMKGGAAPLPAREGSGSGVPAIVFHGDADTPVHPGNGAQVIADLLQAGGASVATERGVAAGRGFTRAVHRDAAGLSRAELWQIEGAGHAWSGGSASGSYTDARGPDATREMLRFFLEHRQRGRN